MAGYSIFISYAHEDEAFKNALTQQLKGLQRQGVIGPWDDRCIDAGDEWRSAIGAAIDDCHLALLLVNPAFIASDFIYTEELSRLVERRDREGIRVVPIIVKPCAWKHEKPIKSLQARPKDGKPIVTFPEEDGARAQAWVDIVEEIARWAKQHGESKSTHAPDRTSALHVSPIHGAEPPAATAGATRTSSGQALARELVYISYRHLDREWHKKLRAILDADPRLRDLVWDDTKIPSSANVWEQIAAHVACARIMIMLGSDDYFAPDSVPMQCEVTPALAAHARNELTILWFPVRPVAFAAAPVSHIMVATGVGARPLDALSPEEQTQALLKIYHEVLNHLGLLPLPASPERPDKKREPPMLPTRIPEPDARRDLQKIAGCDDDSREIDVVFIHGLGGDAWTTWMADQDDIATFWPNWAG